MKTFTFGLYNVIVHTNMDGQKRHLVIFALFKDGKVLVEKRPADSALAGELVFPGGAVEEDETYEQAMLRESIEELGIRPRDYAYVSTKERIYGVNNINIHIFLIKDWDGDVPESILDKGNPLKWVDLKSLTDSPVESVKKIADALIMLLQI